MSPCKNPCSEVDVPLPLRNLAIRQRPPDLAGQLRLTFLARELHLARLNVKKATLIFDHIDKYGERYQGQRAAVWGLVEMNADAEAEAAANYIQTYLLEHLAAEFLGLTGPREVLQMHTRRSSRLLLDALYEETVFPIVRRLIRNGDWRVHHFGDRVNVALVGVRDE